MDTSVDATILHLATGDTGPTSTIHTFEGGGSTERLSNDGSASGIGDIIIRAKYHFLKAGGGGLAAGLDLRTPTGDADNLLGTGATQAKLLLIGSTEKRMFAPHFNIGYTFSSGSSNDFINITDEFNYVFGTEFVAHPKVTIAADVVGRQFRDSGKLVEEAKTFNFMNAAGVRGSATFNEFTETSGSLNNVIGAVGAKFNPAPNLLISANILFPFTDAGIRSKVVPVIGFDYSF
jgi:outer membrane putative beta-barrel porin/alpha-amylase